MMRISLLHALIPWFFLGGLVSCIEEVDLKTQGGETKLVIDGEITNQNAIYRIKLSRSADFSESQFGIVGPETGASVAIISNTNETAILTEVEPGVYETNFGEIVGTIGSSYYLEVTTNDGKTYQSCLEMLQPVTPVDNLSYESVKEEEISSAGNIVTKNFVKVFADTEIPNNPENVYFKWDMFGEYEFFENIELLNARTCYIEENININNIAIFSGESLTGRQLRGQEIVKKEVDFQFGGMYCFHVYQKSLSREAYQYWKNTKSLIEISGSLFDEPPGQIRGNMFNINDPSEEVLGYFSASAVDTSRLFIPGLTLEGAVRICAESGELPPTCNDCLSIENSSLQRPEYWP